MNPDIESEYGYYTSNPVFRKLISFAQRAPQNWFGQQLAQLVRKLVLGWGQLPIDVAVGSIKMRCYLRDNNSEKKFVFMPWRFDKRERELLIDNLPKSGTFVDIGANVGIYTLTAATHMDSRGRVVAMEPNPPAFERLTFNIKATRFGCLDWPRIDALQVGVGDTEAELELHLDPKNLGSSSITTHAAGIAGRNSGGGTVRITCKPLLDILRELSIDRVDVIKIDIEGAEDKALFPYLMGLLDVPSGIGPGSCARVSAST
ncbi:FkbM family methyltransferase [Ectothiorhodospira mobilis]|uniref:FkbM family methyltransferase n=1 Tax=Ectothiorhodospira mobilis TaxID=195064 RepID=UPI0019057BBE|nr:FkbM family methyltransferase [Ectothiorhodospira mobilis]